MKIEDIKLALKKNQEVNVQLALIDDVKSTIAKAKNSFLSARDAVNKAAIEFSKAEQITNEALTLANKGVALAKELGADASVTELNKYIQGLNENAKSASNAISKLKSI